MASAGAVAAAIRSRLTSPGKVKVHKLLYYCQGWHYTWTGAPLFAETIEAWENGPVVADLWRAETYDIASPASGNLDAEEERTVDYVLNRYGKLWGNQLIGKTHQEAPWRDARERGSSARVTLEAMGEFFAEDPAADQAWFWDADWQRGEQEATDDIREGRTETDASTDEFLASLRSLRADV